MKLTTARLACLLMFWMYLLAPAARGQLKPLHIESPRYPEMARIALIQGKVELKITVGPEGSLRVEARGGDKLLQTQAVANVRLWRFERPAGSQEVTQTIEFIFELEEPRLEHACARVSFDLPSRVRIVSNLPPINTQRTRMNR